jgi:hypothetical protein
MEKSPATDENVALYILWAVPDTVIRMQYYFMNLEDSQKISNELWQKILMYSFQWALEQLKAKNAGALPTMAQVMRLANWTLINTTADSPFGRFLSEQLGLTQTQQAIKLMFAFSRQTRSQ